MRTLTYDIETYFNYALFAFRDVATKELITFEIRGETDTLSKKQIKKMTKLLTENTIVTYYGLGFDEPITAYAFNLATAPKIYKAVQMLIVDEMPSWKFYRKTNTEKFITHHIDIMDVARGSASLKLYGARLGTRKLQDLPYAPETKLTETQMDIVLDYCENDNILTQELFDYLHSDLELRTAMGKQYGMNFMSYKGAKIAEMILVKECEYTGQAPARPPYIKYEAPKYIKFKTKELQELFENIKAHTFLIMNNGVLKDIEEYGVADEYQFLLEDLGIAKATKPRVSKKTKKTVTNSGNVIQPDFLDAPIVIDGVSHKLGLGGVHGSIEETTITVEDDETIADIDYKSLYPSLIIQNKFVPAHISDIFLSVYGGMYHERNNVLKPAMKTVEYGSEEYKDLDRKQDTMKLVLNSSFGQTGQRFSKIYDPSAMLHTTITGQLTLMMVIEKLSLKGFKTFYANTDGITLKIKKKDLKKVQKITRKFDKKTGLEMEYNFFKASHIRDVNNFINITTDGKVKSKGAYAEPNLEKNAQTPIVFEAVRKFLQDETPIEDTIRACTSVHDFCSSMQVNGGAVFAKDLPEMYPPDWQAKLDSPRGLTKKIIKDREKMEALWVKDNGAYLGKVVRWYYSTKGNSIHRKASGYKVPMTDGCKPMMDLTKKLPKDLDYERYFELANRYLADLGYFKY